MSENFSSSEKRVTVEFVYQVRSKINECLSTGETETFDAIQSAIVTFDKNLK